MLESKNFFIRYLREADMEGSGPLGYQEIPRGCLVFERLGPGKVRYGWSRCSDHDQFTYKMARRIAMGRMLKEKRHPMPKDMLDFYNDTWPMVELWLEGRDARPEAR